MEPLSEHSRTPGTFFVDTGFGITTYQLQHPFHEIVEVVIKDLSYHNQSYDPKQQRMLRLMSRLVVDSSGNPCPITKFRDGKKRLEEEAQTFVIDPNLYTFQYNELYNGVEFWLEDEFTGKKIDIDTKDVDLDFTTAFTFRFSEEKYESLQAVKEREEQTLDGGLINMSPYGFLG